MPPPRQTDRAFGLMFAVVFAAVAGVGFFIFGVVLTWAIATAAVFLVVALALSWVLLPLNRLWVAFAGRLGRFNNFLLLGIFFYLFILPAGLVMRLFNDPLQRKIDPSAGSYWSPVGRKAEIETYRDLF